MTQVQHWAKMAQTDHVTLWPWPLRSWRLWLMRVVVFHPCIKFEVRRPCRSEDMAADVSALMGLVTLTFDLLTLKLVCESHQSWRTFGFSSYLLCMWRTDGRTDKINAYYPLSFGRGHKNAKAPTSIKLGMYILWVVGQNFEELEYGTELRSLRHAGPSRTQPGRDRWPTPSGLLLLTWLQIFHSVL